MATDEIRCSKCRFWGTDKRGSMAAVCRRYPARTDGSWPETRSRDWCGEFSLMPAPIETKEQSHDR